MVGGSNGARRESVVPQQANTMAVKVGASRPSFLPLACSTFPRGKRQDSNLVLWHASLVDCADQSDTHSRAYPPRRQP